MWGVRSTGVGGLELLWNNVQCTRWGSSIRFRWPYMRRGNNCVCKSITHLCIQIKLILCLTWVNCHWKRSLYVWNWTNFVGKSFRSLNGIGIKKFYSATVKISLKQIFFFPGSAWMERELLQNRSAMPNKHSRQKIQAPRFIRYFFLFTLLRRFASLSDMQRTLASSRNLCM